MKQNQKQNARSRIRTGEPLREWALNPSPLTYPAILARYTNQRIECLNLVPDPKSVAFDLA